MMNMEQLINQLEQVQMDWLYLKHICLKYKSILRKYNLFPYLSKRRSLLEDDWAMWAIRVIFNRFYDFEVGTEPFNVLRQIADLLNTFPVMRTLSIHGKVISFPNIYLKPDYISKMNHSYWGENWPEYNIEIDRAIEEGFLTDRPTTLMQMKPHHSRIVQRGFALEFIGFCISNGLK
jgi:hypothetical protein